MVRRSWDGGRGWVYSEYLAFDERGEMVPLPDVGPAYFRIPFVTFVARDYWDRWYVGRPWYRDRDRWYGYRIRPRVGWHAPPPGPRRSGWWRQNYHAPPGMRPPPGRGWRRPEHYERDAAMTGDGTTAAMTGATTAETAATTGGSIAATTGRDGATAANVAKRNCKRPEALPPGAFR